MERRRMSLSVAAVGAKSFRLVAQIKQKSAELIDLCEGMRANNAPNEVQRLISLAQTHYEDASMWAVKAATAEK
jgi:hypothetical protein